MARYLILSRMPQEDTKGLKDLRKIEITKALETECPGLVWIGRHTIRGYYNTMDVLEIESPEQVDKVLRIFKEFDKIIIDTSGSEPWKEFVISLS